MTRTKHIIYRTQICRVFIANIIDADPCVGFYSRRMLQPYKSIKPIDIQQPIAIL